MSKTQNELSLKPSSILPANPAGMTMVEHLAELRNRLLISLGAALLGVTIAFFNSLPMIELLKKMADPVLLHAGGQVEFVQITPGEVLVASMKLSIFIGVALASPVILYQLMRFILPGLAKREKWLLLIAVMAGFLLFIAGLAFAYYLVVPSALVYLLEYGQQVAKSQISIALYLDFCASLLLLSGVVFELPLMLFLLALIGLIKSSQLISQWRVAIVAIAFAAAILTPSQDPLTMIMVAVAMAGLYFISIIPIRCIGK